MDPKRWKQIDELLDAVLDQPESERESFLSSKCNGDDGLKNEVISLLKAQDSDDFLEHSAMRVAAMDLAASGGPPAGESGKFLTSTIEKYKVEAMLGAGGMGEVYLAHDGKLDRKIALKLLHGDFVTDNERLKRFDLEAKAISALNHPNIVTIYDVGNSDGTNYIATEFVEGKTLRQLISEGIPLKEVLSIAIQICDALSAAHSAGIIHRDIKPENIMVRPDGYAKILDFGLVKLTQESQRVEQDFNKTGKGVILGTPAYMSPEQITGEFLDHRTDLWSVGVVLYEMLTGKNPFKAENRHSTLKSVLTLQPEPVSSLNDTLPPELDQILIKALEKDADMSYQTASDLRADLKRVKREMDSSPSWSSSLSVSTIRARRSRRKYFFAAAAAILVLILAGTAWTLYSTFGTVDDAPNWSQATTSQLTSTQGLEGFPSLSPDGKNVVYFGMNGNMTDIFWQRVGGTNTTNLTPNSPGNDTMPVFSPDGNHIAFRSDREPAGLYVMGATGENAKRVSDTGFHPSWSPDGKRIAVSDKGASIHTFHAIPNSAIYVVDFATGEKKKLDTGGDAIQPNWSPNGHRIAYWYLIEGQLGNIATIPADGGEPVVIADNEATDWNPVWSPDGKYLYFSSDRGGNMNLWRIRVDEQSGRSLGEPEAVPAPSKYCRHVTFSRDGKIMAYSSYDGESNLQTLPFDPVTGKITGGVSWVTAGDKEVSSPHMSPDGEKYVTRTVERTQEDLTVFNKDGTGPLKITNDKFLERRPRWSPDGKRIAFQSNRSGKYQIWTANADGSDLQQVTFVETEGAISPVWSPNGRELAYTQIDGKQRRTMFVQSGPGLHNEHHRTASPVSIAASFEAHTWAGDGERLLGVFKDEKERSAGIGYYHCEKGRYEKVADFGFFPVWLNDAKQFIFSDEENTKIFLGDINGKVTELYSPPTGGIQHVDISPDNRTIYFRYFRVESDIWLLDSSEKK